MAFGAGTINSFGGAVGDIFGGQATAAGLRLKAYGDMMAAKNYDLAAGLAKQNADYTATSTEIKEVQAERQLYLGLGTTQTDIAGSGFSMSGSGLDILRSGAAQGALTKQVVGAQGQITEAGYIEQSVAYTNMAEAARYAARVEQEMADDAESNSWITAGFKVAAGLTSLFTI